MAAGGLTKREEEESVWDNLVDDSGENTDYRATPIVGYEDGDWNIELPGVETEEEAVDTDTGNTETDVAPVVEQQTNVAGALTGQTEEQTEPEVPEEVGQRLVRSNTEEENPVITEEADQTPANLWTQWENLQNAEEEETAQQNTAQAEEEQRLVQSLYPDWVTEEWLNTEDGQYWLESQQTAQQPEMLFPEDNTPQQTMQLEPMNWTAARETGVNDAMELANNPTFAGLVQAYKNEGMSESAAIQNATQWMNDDLNIPQINVGDLPTWSEIFGPNEIVSTLAQDFANKGATYDVATGAAENWVNDNFSLPSDLDLSEINPFETNEVVTTLAQDFMNQGATYDVAMAAAEKWYNDNFSLPDFQGNIDEARKNFNAQMRAEYEADELHGLVPGTREFDEYVNARKQELLTQPYSGLNSGEVPGAENYIPGDQRADAMSNLIPQNADVAAALGENFNPYGIGPADLGTPQFFLDNPQYLDAYNANPEEFNNQVQFLVNNVGLSRDRAEAVAAQDLYGDSSPNNAGLHLQHLLAKGEQSVVNSVIIDQDRRAYVEENMPDESTFGSEREIFDAETALLAEYDRLYPNGRPELDLLTTDEILGHLDEVRQTEQDRIDAMRQGYEESAEAAQASRNAAWLAAENAGLDPATQEFVDFVNDYEAEWERRNEQSAEYEALIESQNVDKNDVQAVREEAEQREAEQRRQDYIDTLMERSNARDEYELRNNRYIYGVPGYTDNGEPDTIRPNDAMEQLLRGGQYGYGSEAPAYNEDGTPNDLLQAILDGKFSSSMEEWGMYLQGLGVLTPENAPKYQEYLRVTNAEAALNAFDMRDGTGFQGLSIPDEIKPFIASNLGKAVGGEQTMYMSGDGQLHMTEKNENIEKVRAPEEQYRAALDALIQANPSLKAMIDAGVVTKDDIMFHFMKGLIVTKPGSGKGSGTGTARYGGGGGGGGGGGRGGSGGYGSSGGNSAKRQQESRINNIMKNWTF